MPILTVSNLSKQYRLHSHKSSSLKELFLKNLLKRKAKSYIWALREVSFSVEKGKTLGIIGSNGSGKSTLLKAISGVTFPTEGTVEVDGRVGALLELGAGFHPDFSGLENVYLNGAIIGLSKSEIDSRLDEIIEFSEIRRFMNTPVKHYSSGMYVRLAFAIAVHLDPDILLIDEVLSVGDEGFQVKSFDKIKQFKKLGKTIVFVTHDLDVAESICDEIIWLEKGRIKAYDTTDKIVALFRAEVFKRTIPDEPMDVDIQFAHVAPSGRLGSGEVLLTSVRILNSENKDVRKIVNGERVVIELNYNARQTIENPDFRIGIANYENTQLSLVSSIVHGLSVPKIEGEGKVTATIDSFPLKAGRYFLSAAIAPEGEHYKLYDLHLRLYPFTVVEQDESINYILDLPYTCKIS